MRASVFSLGWAVILPIDVPADVWKRSAKGSAVMVAPSWAVLLCHRRKKTAPEVHFLTAATRGRCVSVKRSGRVLMQSQLETERLHWSIEERLDARYKFVCLFVFLTHL